MTAGYAVFTVSPQSHKGSIRMLIFMYPQQMSVYNVVSKQQQQCKGGLQLLSQKAFVGPEHSEQVAGEGHSPAIPAGLLSTAPAAALQDHGAAG